MISPPSSPPTDQKTVLIDSPEDRWVLILYLAGMTPRARNSLAQLRSLCEEYMPGRYSLEVIDLHEKPELAERDQIIAIPTLIRKLPEPVRRLVGDLSLKEKVLIGLEIHPQPVGLSDGKK